MTVQPDLCQTCTEPHCWFSHEAAHIFSAGGGDTSDEMQKLEEKARQLAEESMDDQANKPDKGILFVR